MSTDRASNRAITHQIPPLCNVHVHKVTYIFGFSNKMDNICISETERTSGK